MLPPACWFGCGKNVIEKECIEVMPGTGSGCFQSSQDIVCEVDLFEVLEIMAQMWHYIIFF